MVIGSTIMPLSERFTLSTSLACCSMVRLRWMMPSPPCWAMAMAMRDSVTVSMAALIRGTRSSMLRVRRVVVSDQGRNNVGLGGQQQHVIKGQRLRDRKIDHDMYSVEGKHLL